MEQKYSTGAKKILDMCLIADLLDDLHNELCQHAFD